MACSSSKEDSQHIIKWNPRSSLDTFLKEYVPSEVTDINTYWLRVEMPRHLPNMRLAQTEVYVHQLWKDLTGLKHKKDVSYKDVLDIARETMFLTGKWVAKLKNVDNIWITITKATTNGELGTSAQVSCRSMARVFAHHYYILQIETKNMMDRADVKAIKDKLRECGVLVKLKYKPDIYRCLGIYRRDPYGINPNLYLSESEVPVEKKVKEKTSTED